MTATATSTACVPPNPSYYIVGTVQYAGTGTVDFNHEIRVLGAGKNCYLATRSGTYVIGAYSSGSYRLVAFYNLNGIKGFPVPGQRYSSSGVCADPFSATGYPVTITGSAGTTTMGPTITFDDICSYQGFYGTAEYTGTKGIAGICRRIYIRTYSDPSYSTILEPRDDISENDGVYSIVTNTGTFPTGLTPVYVQAFFDADGTYTFTAGDPYINLGLVTPTADGLLFNITFGDTNIK